MNNINHSIKRQYPIIFGCLLLGSILLVSFLNFILLGKMYLFFKEITLKKSYALINEAAEEGDINSDVFSTTLKAMASVNNIDVIILGSDTETIVTTDREPKFLTIRLLDYIFSDGNTGTSICKEDNFQIDKSSDPRLNLEYLELWGVLSTNDLILIRTPIESIKEAASIANRVLIACGILITILGFGVIWFVSKKLTDPIMKLVSISEKITQLDFSEKYTVSNGNEIDVLGCHINTLSDSLENTILELKEANTELQRDIDKKIEIDEMRKDFISNVSHELKTPIALVQGYAEGLKDCVNDDEESREYYCDVIIDEAGRMNKLVRSLLDLNELEFGINNVDIEHFDILELIRNCVASFDILIKNENISLELSSEQDSVYVWADEFKIEQIVNNYLSNAVHYCKYDKVIRISLQIVDDLLRVGIFNTGDPIPEDVLPHLWDKFYKADKARTREYGGSGIGLSIVKASMEAMGRGYGVKNQDNGVEFWFEVDLKG